MIYFPISTGTAAVLGGALLIDVRHRYVRKRSFLIPGKALLEEIEKL